MGPGETAWICCLIWAFAGHLWQTYILAMGLVLQIHALLVMRWQTISLFCFLILKPVLKFRPFGKAGGG